MHLSGLNLRKSSTPGAHMGHRDTGIASVISGCKALGCANPAVIGHSGQGQDVCLEHFFSTCYDQLEKIESLTRNRSVDPAEVKSVCGVLEECSKRAIFICFRNEPLTNLERSRLLEILLSCRELQLRLTNRAFLSPQKPI
jgi:hypothetical protein